MMIGPLILGSQKHRQNNFISEEMTNCAKLRAYSQSWQLTYTNFGTIVDKSVYLKGL